MSSRDSSSVKSRRHRDSSLMDSMEADGGSGRVQEGESRKERTNIKNREDKDNEKKAKPSYVKKFLCLRTERDEKGNFDMEVEDIGGDRPSPIHLVIMVNGIIGSAQNWRYAAKQFLKKYPRDLVVHCSECNYSMLTFDGVDVMGERLAEEVILVIRRHPSVQKISFIGHSLGGLVARYAIARLYGLNVSGDLAQENGKYRSDASGDLCQKQKFEGKIAGLEPMNFITSASPHLGSRGHKQVPVFCGLYTLEKVAARASWCLGRTGKHLFLADSDKGKPPLLLQMVNDQHNLKFISALQSFRRRVAYANACSDHLVGWSTSSLRHWNELPKIKHLKKDDRYPHILNRESVSPQLEVTLETITKGNETIEPEEQILRGLRTMSWEVVDVCFSGSKQRFLAHSTIQVKNYWLNSDGADVIQHMIDNFLL